MDQQERSDIILVLLEAWNRINEAELGLYGAIEEMGVDPTNPPQFEDAGRQRVTLGLVALADETDGLIAGVIDLLRELGYAGEEELGTMPPERRQGHGPRATEALLAWAQEELERQKGEDGDD